MRMVLKNATFKGGDTDERPVRGLLKERPLLLPPQIRGVYEFVGRAIRAICPSSPLEFLFQRFSGGNECCAKIETLVTCISYTLPGCLTSTV